MLLKANFTQSE